MDEQKRYLILNSIIKELIEKTKDQSPGKPKQRHVIDLSEVIFEMEARTKVS